MCSPTVYKLYGVCGAELSGPDPEQPVVEAAEALAHCTRKALRQRGLAGDLEVSVRTLQRGKQGTVLLADVASSAERNRGIGRLGQVEVCG